MKRILYINSLLSLTCVLALISCSSQEELIETTVEDLDVAVLYEEAISRWEKYNDSMVDNFVNQESRKTPDNIPPRVFPANDIAGYFLSLSEEEIDTLYEEFNVEQELPLLKNIYDLKIDSLINVSSAKEVQDLYSFMNEYTLNGGHDVESIELFVSKLNSPVVKTVTINAGAHFDTLTSIETANYLSHFEIDGEINPCRKKLIFDLAVNSIDVVGTAMDYAEGDYIIAIISTDRDILSIIDAFHKYRICERLSHIR